MSASKDKKALREFITSASEELGDKRLVSELNSSLQKISLGPWRFPLWGLFVANGLLLFRIVVSLIRGQSVASFLAALVVLVPLSIGLYLVVKTVRNNDEQSQQELWVLRATAEDAAARLEAQNPSSSLLKDWAEIK